MSYNPKSLFNKIQQREKSQAEASGTSSYSANPLLFKPKVGNTYAVRLLWLPPAKDCDREYPMINSYIHRIWDESATSGNKDHKVICPTSQYMMGEVPAAFRKCPICTAASDFYKKGQDGSESASELYSKFRRTCMGYIPIYIVNGPEEDIGQIKILQYGKQFKDFFDTKIFGITKQSKNNEEQQINFGDEAIGIDAFMYYDESLDSVVGTGYDLIINTSTKKMAIKNKQVDMPQYKLDFSRKVRTITELNGIDITTNEGINYFNSLNADVLHFDEDFYLKSTDAELQEFKLAHISSETISSTPTAEASTLNTLKNVATHTTKDIQSVSKSEEKDEIPYNFDNKSNTDVSDDEIDALIDDLV